ncbi:MAG: EAL domain-containing protein [Phormidesmis sp.]
MSDSSTVLSAQHDETVSVLIVDDILTNQFILAKLLTREGYQVYQAKDGLKALALAASHQPTLVLLDIMMPGINGYEVCDRLRSNPVTASIPIIFLSALNAPFDKIKAFQSGAADYVTKPFQAEEVLARVRHQVNLQLAQQAQKQLQAELESRVQERTQLLELAHDQLLEIALSDRLTQLPNRLSFVNRLGKLMAQAQLHPDHHFAVVFLDCDRFKRINDSLGHCAGDRLLKGIARRLTKIQQRHTIVDTISRFGGDEFALLLTNVPNQMAVEAIAEDIVSTLSLPFSLDSREIIVSVSMGLVWGELDYQAAEHLLRDADMAMYRAKDCGRSHYLWFESAMHNRAVHLLQLESDLHLALEREEFVLYYQPIVDLQQLKIVGFEALVRWQHPTRGLIMPDEFISFAEETGFIVPLGEQVLRMACNHIARWEQTGLLDAEITISVNIAAQQLLQSNILKHIDVAIQASGIKAHRLRFELTERSIINNNVAVDEVLRTLQRRKIQLSIDDFGIGYSALNYLQTLPVNCLKIDRSFVQPITSQLDSLGIVPLIINIARTMGMQTVAEGIEDTTQLWQLRQLGCEYGQGYLFREAVPAELVIALLSRSLPLIPLDQPRSWIEAATA